MNIHIGPGWCIMHSGYEIVGLPVQARTIQKHIIALLSVVVRKVSFVIIFYRPLRFFYRTYIDTLPVVQKTGYFRKQLGFNGRAMILNHCLNQEIVIIGPNKEHDEGDDYYGWHPPVLRQNAPHLLHRNRSQSGGGGLQNL